MVILKPQSEFGHAPPPQSPYSIITNLPSWDLWYNLREGDSSPLARLVHIYPRFAPTHSVAQVSFVYIIAPRLSGSETKQNHYYHRHHRYHYWYFISLGQERYHGYKKLRL